MANNQQNVNAVKASRFDGGLLGLIGTGFLAFLAFILSVALGAIVLVVAIFFGGELLGGFIQDADMLNIVLWSLYIVGGI